MPAARRRTVPRAGSVRIGDDAQRRGTRAAGRLPTFLLIGSPKAGTTSLAAHLAAHPQVYVAAEKEVHFFDQQWDRGVDWYRSRFAAAPVTAQQVGEASPTYLADPASRQRMAETVPDARMLAILRHPVDRAYSTYWWRHAFETRSFVQAARDEMREDALSGYLGDGRYVHHLRRLAEHYPRERTHVLLLDDLSRDPHGSFAAVCRFLGVDDGVVPAGLEEVHNPAFRFRSRRLLLLMLRSRAWRRAPRLAAAVDRLNRAPLTYPPIDPALRAELCAWFAPDNAALAEWLGRDLPGWDR